MCDTLQISWKLPSVPKPMKSRDGHRVLTPLQERQIKRRKKDDAAAEGKYTLRACSIQKRIETEHRKGMPRKRGPKPRPKSAPMSKYRRKTANLRERLRMGEINTAFEFLREKLPPMAGTVASGGSNSNGGRGKCEKLTKINILHVAVNYIRALENILDTGSAGVNIYGTSVVQSPDLPISPEAMAPDEAMPGENADSGKALGKARKARTPTLREARQQCNAGFCCSAKGGGGCCGRRSSSSFGSGSEDSGIVDMDDDDDVDDDGDGDDPDGEDADDRGRDGGRRQKGGLCPDWTELTSTLEFPQPLTANLANVLQPLLGSASNPPQAGTAQVGNHLLLLLSSAAPSQQQQQPPPTAREMVFAKEDAFKKSLLFSRQSSFSDVCVFPDDGSGCSLGLGLGLLGDLDSSFESLDGLCDLTAFGHDEDPLFQQVLV